MCIWGNKLHCSCYNSNIVYNSSIPEKLTKARIRIGCLLATYLVDGEFQKPRKRLLRQVSRWALHASRITDHCDLPSFVINFMDEDVFG